MTGSGSNPFSHVRSPRAWVANVAATIVIGLGIGVMLLAGIGVSPLDAAFAGIANATGFTVGTVLIGFSIVFVAIGWALKHPPGPGTVISFLGIGVAVDVTMSALAGAAIPDMSLGLRIAIWVAGLAVFCVGVVFLFASRLGASPYDQIVLATASRTGLSLGKTRLLFDAVAVLAAFALGGGWGVGTVVILLVVPVVLSKALPPVQRWVHPAPSDDSAA